MRRYGAAMAKPMGLAMAGLATLMFASGASAQTGTLQIGVLADEAVLEATQAAYRACAKDGYQVAVAVVGRDGRLQGFWRHPLSGPHTVEVAQRKAYTAATYRASTAAMAGRQELAATPGVLLVGGGLPIEVAGQFYGAIGVSGAPRRQTAGDVDEACARAGVEAVQTLIELGG